MFGSSILYSLPWSSMQESGKNLYNTFLVPSCATEGTCEW